MQGIFAGDRFRQLLTNALTKILHAEIVVNSAKVSVEMKAYQPIPMITDFQNEIAPITLKKLSKPTIKKVKAGIRNNSLFVHA